MKILSIVGVFVMTISAIGGLASEVPEGAPMSQQLAVWASAVVVFMAGYGIHRLGGGSFRFRDLFEE